MSKRHSGKNTHWAKFDSWMAKTDNYVLVKIHIGRSLIRGWRKRITTLSSKRRFVQCAKRKERVIRNLLEQGSCASNFLFCSDIISENGGVNENK